MSERTDRDSLSDIQEVIRRIMEYTAGMTYQAFVEDTKTKTLSFETWRSSGKQPRICRRNCEKGIPRFHGKVWQVFETD